MHHALRAPAALLLALMAATGAAGYLLDRPQHPVQAAPAAAPPIPAVPIDIASNAAIVPTHHLLWLNVNGRWRDVPE